MRIFLKESKGKNVEIYRKIMELVARFGYVSIREVMYGFDLPIQKAIDRLTYLSRCKLVRQFESGTMPQQFYCLTPRGKDEVQRFQISDEIRDFQPARDYNLIYQHHERLLVKSYIALKKTFEADFNGWVSEAQLKKEYVGVGARVIDGEFYIMAGENKKKCGLELELTMKSPARYRRQFERLAGQVYNSWGKKQEIDILIFLYQSDGIFERLKERASPLFNEWGKCQLYFCQVDEFFEKLGEARLAKLEGGNSEKVFAKEIR